MLLAMFQELPLAQSIFMGSDPGVILVRGMQHNLFIDSNPEADTRHRVSGLPLTFSRKETLQ